MIDIQWEAPENCTETYDGSKLLFTSCAYNIEVSMKSQCTWITAHYPGRSEKVGVWDSKDDPRTFYNRAEEVVKKKYPGAIYSYLIPTEEETEQINDYWMNQLFTWTGNKTEE